MKHLLRALLLALLLPTTAFAQQTVRVNDGGDVTQGTQADAAWVSGNGTVIGLLKNLAASMAGAIPSCGSLATCPTIGGTFPVANSIGAATNYTNTPVGGGGAALNPNIKNAGATLYAITITNTGTHIANVRVYNTSSAPTCSSATNLMFEFDMMSSATSPGMSPNLGPVGVALSNGFSLCISGAYGNTDTSVNSWTTGDIVINAVYK